MVATAQTNSKKSAKNKSTAVAKTNQNQALAEVPDYGDEYDQGYDPNAAEDLLIPRLIVLQTNSPQCLPPSEGGIDGAAAGKLYNTVTQEVMDSCTFVPACSEKVYNEWIHRDDGGGFIARYELTDKIVIDKRKETPRGAIEWEEDGKRHQLKETVYLYCIPVDDEGVPLGGFCVLDFTSTKLSEWRTFNTKLHTFTIPTKTGKRRPPLYGHRVKVSTQMKTKDKDRWFVPVMEPAKEDLRSSLIPPTAVAFSTAKDLADLVRSGIAKPTPQEDQSDGAPPKAGGDKSKGAF